MLIINHIEEAELHNLQISIYDRAKQLQMQRSQIYINMALILQTSLLQIQS
jgi:hypothetical protein